MIEAYSWVAELDGLRGKVIGFGRKLLQYTHV